MNWLKKIILPLLMASGIAMAADMLPAQKQLSDNIRTVLSIVRDGKLNDTQKINKIEKYADGFLDYERLSALAVGHPWRSFTTAQKTAFTDAFKGMLVNMYAGAALQAAKNANFIVLPETRDLGNGRLRLFTTMAVDGKTFRFGYDVIPTGNIYKIYNISGSVDGALSEQSFLPAYRNQIGELINQYGVDGMIEQIRKKALVAPESK